MNALANIVRKLLPNLKKALPFIGVGGAVGIGSFCFGRRWEYARCEKKYAKIRTALKELQRKVGQLEVEGAPQRKIKKAERELRETRVWKIEIEQKLESLRREA